MHFCVWTEHLKSAWHRRREEELMKKLMEIVNDRNAIVDGLDEDRLRSVDVMSRRLAPLLSECF